MATRSSIILENSTERGAWGATVRGSQNSQIGPSNNHKIDRPWWLNDPRIQRESGLEDDSEASSWHRNGWRNACPKKTRTSIFHFKKEALHSQHRLGIFIAVLNYDMLELWQGIGQRQVSYLCQKIAKKYFNPDKPSRDQGKYYLKLLQFSKRRAFVFCGLRCMRKQRRRLALRMKMHFSDKAAHSFIPNFQILNAISILPPLRRDPAFGFPY